MSDEEHDGPPRGPWEANAAGRSTSSHQGGDDGPDCSRPGTLAATRRRRRCSDCNARVRAGDPPEFEHEPGCPALLAMARGERDDADAVLEALARGEEYVVRGVRGDEFDVLTLAAGLYVPRRERRHWRVVLRPLPGGRRFRVVKDPSARTVAGTIDRAPWETRGAAS